MKTASYIWSYTNDTLLYKMHMIEEYSRVNGFTIDCSYCDVGKRRKASAKDVWKAKRLGLTTPKGRKHLPQWENLMIAITERKIDTILVCNRIELASSPEEAKILDHICQEYGVDIIELHTFQPQPFAAMSPKAAIYHSSSAVTRPVIVIKDVDDMINYATSQKWEVVGLHIDTGIYSHRELESLIESAHAEVLVFKSIMHISRHVELAVSLLQRAAKRGMRIISMKEGELTFLGTEEYGRRKALVCNRRILQEEKRISQKKIEVFIKLKTNWSVSGFVNIPILPSELLKEEYDCLVVEHFRDFGSDSVDLIKMLRRTKRPIYSLQEGGVALTDGK